MSAAADATASAPASAFRLSTDPAELDRDRIHRWVSEESTWARGRSRQKQDAAIDGSVNFAAFDTATGEQVGYARLITDGATFAWLADVFVDEAFRGRGVARLLVGGVCAYVDPRGLKRTVLVTSTASGLYRRFGFEPLTADTWMVRGTH